MEIKDINQEKALNYEWIATNGIGGYCSSTISGCNTRKYHGLLVASLNPPVNKSVIVANLFEAVIVGDKRYELSTHKFDVLSPNGSHFLKRFSNEHIPEFEMEFESSRLIKKVCMINGKNATVINYQIDCAQSGSLHIHPVITSRGFHEVKGKSELWVDFERKLDSNHDGMFEIIKFNKNSLPLMIGIDSGNYEPCFEWFNNFNYDREKERGYPYCEDLINPAKITVPLSQGKNSINLIFMIADDESLLKAEFNEFVKKKDYLVEHEIDRIKHLLHHVYQFNKIPANRRLSSLLIASDQFIAFRRSTGKKTVIAGYHWFDDWGRDTLISLEGLCISTGRFNDARNILYTFSSNIKNGLVPNVFLDNNGVVYNNVDSSLWFFIAVYKYYLASKDREFVEEMYQSMQEIVENYLKGTDFDIKADADGLVNIGSDKNALTWMDAKIGDFAVTPRNGKPVEIQALWFNCLRILEFFSILLSRKFPYDNLLFDVKNSFNLKFWNDETQCLFDVVNAAGKDASVRPNQIFAVSLPFSILSREKEKKVVAKVKDALLTRYGLRTLAKDDPKYKGYYSGDQAARDSAYHQGTVWPWLFGHFIEAYLKVNNYSNDSIAFCKNATEDFLTMMDSYGIGTLPEIVEADTMVPKGCISQAWSVAEAIRAYMLSNGRY